MTHLAVDNTAVVQPERVPLVIGCRHVLEHVLHSDRKAGTFEEVNCQIHAGSDEARLQAALLTPTRAELRIARKASK